jgi:hypothetical protein
VAELAGATVTVEACTGPNVPTMPEWGLFLLAGLLLVAGGLMLTYRRQIRL